jgi:uncharacterized membrane protein YdjX (TVP38/TMEM64 family)
MFNQLLEMLRGADPLLILLALAILPLFGAPVSVLWVLTGASLGPWKGFGVAIAGTMINMSLAWLLANRVFRRWLEAFLQKRGYQIPRAEPADYVKLTLALRIIPGVPLFVQSYLLGLANVPYRIYLPVSMPPQIAYAAGFILFGDSLIHMRGGGILAAACLLVAVGLLVKLARRYWNWKIPQFTAKATASPAEQAPAQSPQAEARRCGEGRPDQTERVRE